MGVFDKLAFWKKDDDFSSFEKDFGADPAGTPGSEPGMGLEGLGKNPGEDPGLGGEPNLGFDNKPGSLGGTERPAPAIMSTPAQPAAEQPAYGGYTQPPAPLPREFANPVQPSPDSDRVQKEMEVISSKLDTLKAMIESLNHRIVNIERLAQDEDQKSKRW